MRFPETRLLVAWLVVASLLSGPACAHADGAKHTVIGVAFSPAHVPKQSMSDILAYFPQAAAIGSHVTWIVEWESMPPMAVIRVI